MSDSKLESFKVGERHKPRVKQGGKAKGAGKDEAAASAAEPTLGFARIEAVLDQQDPRQVQKSLAGLVEALDDVSAKAKGAKERAEAKRAKVAVERTTELLTYLFQTKEQMLAAIVQAEGKNDGRKPRGQARKGDK